VLGKVRYLPIHTLAFLSDKGKGFADDVCVRNRSPPGSNGLQTWRCREGCQGGWCEGERSAAG
jgi:hypothetical protein